MADLIFRGISYTDFSLTDEKIQVSTSFYCLNEPFQQAHSVNWRENKSKIVKKKIVKNKEDKKLLKWVKYFKIIPDLVMNLYFMNVSIVSFLSLQILLLPAYLYEVLQR